VLLALAFAAQAARKMVVADADGTKDDEWAHTGMTQEE